MNFLLILRAIVAIILFPTAYTKALWEECLDIRLRSFFTNILPIERKCQVKSWVECHRHCEGHPQGFCNSYTYFKDGGFCRLYHSNNRSIVQAIESDMDVMTVKLKEPCFSTKPRKQRSGGMMPMSPGQAPGASGGMCGPDGCGPMAPSPSSPGSAPAPGPTIGSPGQPPGGACGPGGCGPMAPSSAAPGSVTAPPGQPTQPTHGIMTPGQPAPGSGSPGQPTTTTGSCGPGGCTPATPGLPPPGTGYCGPGGCGPTTSGQPLPPGSPTVAPGQPLTTVGACGPGGCGPGLTTRSGACGPEGCPPVTDDGFSLATDSPIDIPGTDAVQTFTTPLPVVTGGPAVPGPVPQPGSTGPTSQPVVVEPPVTDAGPPIVMPPIGPSPGPPPSPLPGSPSGPSPGHPIMPSPGPPYVPSPGGSSMGPATDSPVGPQIGPPTVPSIISAPPNLPYVPPTSGPDIPAPNGPVIVPAPPDLPYVPPTSGPAVPAPQGPSIVPGPPDLPYVPPTSGPAIPAPSGPAPPAFTMPPVVWMEWGPWGSCSRMCGTGMTVRQRSCKEAAGCEGCTTEMKVCNPQSCCTDWTEWTPCSVTCGQGLQKRSKKCIVESPDLPGGFGSKDMSETQCCTGAMATCSQWGAWQPWNPCSVSCGAGTNVRTRTCEPTPGSCPGPSNETATCNAKACPTWSPWGTWTACSDSCGIGLQFRSRVCSDDSFCPGDSSEKQNCNSAMCPHWAQWSDWGFCSQSCNGGQTTRSRACINDKQFCVGPNANAPACVCGIPTEKNETTETCNNVKCPVPGNWGEWTPCTKPCGGGTRSRTRPCIVDQAYCTKERMTEKTCMCPGPGDENQACNTQSCSFWTEWGPWSTCSVTCGNGTLTRKRTCNNDKTTCAGELATSPACLCLGNDTESQGCDAGPCYTWSSWSKWSGCTVLCGGGSRNRTRQCPLPDSCPGLDGMTDICNMIPCPDWSDWSPWSDCTESCGGGQRSRTRACPIPGACNPGEEYEFDKSPCNPEKCPEWGLWTPWGKCSRTCGQGNRMRSRKCSPVLDGCLGSGDNVEPCMVQPCTVSTEWSRWSPCTSTCGGGVRTRSRVKCPSGPPVCPIEQNTSKCNEQPCPLWSEWGPWGQCSKTCGGGQRIRSRTCPIVNGCVGQNSEIDPVPCNNFGCRR